MCSAGLAGRATLGPLQILFHVEYRKLVNGKYEGSFDNGGAAADADAGSHQAEAGVDGTTWPLGIPADIGRNPSLYIWATARLRRLTPQTPVCTFGLQLAFGVLRPKRQFVHLGLQLAFGVLRPKRQNGLRVRRALLETAIGQRQPEASTP